jgi:ParB family transcriptional regulator, chromosome partitioning protein
MACHRSVVRAVTRRVGLGRGLDALLPPEAEETQGPGPLQAPVDSIEPNPNQPRRDFDDASLAELSASISALGLLQPLLVRPLGSDRFELVAGERRLRAARLAGLTTVPVVLVETDELGSLERALVENIHRADLNPIEEAAAYRQLLDEGGLTQEQLASRLGRSRTAVTNSLRLLELPVAIHDLVVRGRLSAGHARALLPLAESPFQTRLATRVAHEGVSVRATEDLVRRYSDLAGSAAEPRLQSHRRPAAAADAEKRLTEGLQTRVRVSMGQSKGRIAIDFSSEEDLERLLGVMLAASKEGPTVVSPERGADSAAREPIILK